MNLRIKQILATLTLQYPYWEKEKSDAQLTATYLLYDRLLADLPLDVLEVAALAHCASSRFFPVPAELRAQAAEIMLPPRQTALEAWHDANDPLAQKIRRLLPSYNDRMITTKEQAIIRAQFLKYYEQAVTLERAALQQLPIVRAMQAQYQLSTDNDEPAQIEQES
jgi:hypothetical protein